MFGSAAAMHLSSSNRCDDNKNEKNQDESRSSQCGNMKKKATVVMDMRQKQTICGVTQNVERWRWDRNERLFFLRVQLHFNTKKKKLF